MTLRPFTHDYPPASDSTDPHPYRFTYRVVGHVNGMGGRAEEINCVDKQTLPVPEYRDVGEFYQGNF